MGKIQISCAWRNEALYNSEVDETLMHQISHAMKSNGLI